MSDFDYKQLDEIIHSRLRLAIMSILVGVEEAEFTFLRKNLKASDGNLSVSLRKLEEAGYLSIKKTFVQRKPLSTYRLTGKGRKAFEIYIDQLEKFIKPKL